MLRQLSIALRAGIGFGVVALLVFLLGGFSLQQMSTMQRESQEVNEHWLPAIIQLSELNQEFLRIRAATLRLLVADTQAQQQTAVTAIDAVKQAFRSAREKAEPLIRTPEGRKIITGFDQAMADYERYQTQIVELALQGDQEGARALTRGELNQHADAASKAVRELIEFSRGKALEAARLSDDTASQAFNGVVVALLLAAILTVALAILLTRSIVQPLNEAVRVAEVVASGDLTHSISIVGRDEPARLLTALASMQDSLRDTIQRIADSSNQLASAAEELNAVTEDSTRGMHQQNDEIQQAATAVNEMTTAVDEVARNAVATSEASRESDATASTAASRYSGRSSRSVCWPKTSPLPPPKSSSSPSTCVISARCSM